MPEIYIGQEWIKNKTMLDKINLAKKFETINEHWQPKIIGALNGQFVKLAKIKGEFVLHKHDEEDELFMVIEGEMIMELENERNGLKAGEIMIVPKDTLHKPIAENECKILLFEPKSTLNTGDAEDERTKHELDWI